MAKVSGNGRYVKAASRMPADGERKPVGRAPKDFDKDERDAWNIIAAECHWCDKSHRMWVGRASKIMSRLKRIDIFFKTRTAEYRKNKMPDAYAYLNDEGKRHPLMTELHASEEGLRKMLSALGASPAAQVRMLSNISKSQMPAGSDVEGSPADRGRYFS